MTVPNCTCLGCNLASHLLESRGEKVCRKSELIKTQGSRRYQKYPRAVTRIEMQAAARRNQVSQFPLSPLAAAEVTSKSSNWFVGNCGPPGVSHPPPESHEHKSGHSSFFVRHNLRSHRANSRLGFRDSCDPSMASLGFCSACPIRSLLHGDTTALAGMFGDQARTGCCALSSAIYYREPLTSLLGTCVTVK